MLGYENDTKSRISRAWRAIFKIRKKFDAIYYYLTNKKESGQISARCKNKSQNNARGEGRGGGGGGEGVFPSSLIEV